MNHSSAPSYAELASSPGLARRAVLMLLLTLLLVAGAVVYLLYARGVFESTQRLVLVAEDSEGVVVGMDMTFSGFPIGRVRRVELAPDGKARILIDVPKKDAQWLRQSSVFTLVRGLVGATNIRAYSGILTDPPLPDGAVRQVLRGDATADIPVLVGSARALLESVNQLVAPQGALGQTLTQLQRMSERINGQGGAVGVLLGGDEQARRFRATLARADTLADHAAALMTRMDSLAAHADTQVFGAQGLMPQVQGSAEQLQGLLTDARASLGKLDAVLIEAQAVGANARVATQDLGPLRAEVEANLRRVDSMLNELKRKWPFTRDPREAEIKLP
jgi:phospholipid/cholesterol/gamma-HCH transport system substrate-binding protein